MIGRGVLVARICSDWMRLKIKFVMVLEVKLVEDGDESRERRKEKTGTCGPVAEIRLHFPSSTLRRTTSFFCPSQTHHGTKP